MIEILDSISGVQIVPYQEVLRNAHAGVLRSQALLEG